MIVFALLIAFTSAACEANLAPVGAALQTNNVAAAVRLLATVPVECQKTSQYFSLSGVTHELSGDSSEAEAAFRQAVALDPKSAKLRAQLGATFLRNAKPDEAAKALLEALKLDPGNSTIQQYLAGAYVETGAWSQASAVFDELRPAISGASDPTVLLWFAQTLIKTKQFNRLDSSVGPKSTTLSPALLFSLGTLCAKNGLYERAINYLQLISGSDADEAVYFNMALSYSHLNSFESARKNYFLAIDKRPRYVEAYFHIGLDYASAGDARIALPWLFRAHDWASSRSDISYALIEQLIGLDYFETASEVLMRSLTQDPADKLLFVADGDLKLAKGDLDAAMASYRKAFSPENKFAPAAVGLARAHAAKGDTEAARENLRLALAIDPKDPGANGELGLLEARQQNWTTALEHLKRAWALDRSNSTVALELSRSYRHLGQPEEALVVLRKSTPRMRDSVAFHAELAQVYERLHRSVDAQTEQELTTRLQSQAKNGLNFDTPRTYVY